MITHLKYVLFLIVLIYKQKSILCEGPDILELDKENKIDFAQFKARIYKFIYYLYENQTANILHINSTTNNFSNPAYIYVSFDKNISEDNTNFSSQNLGINQLYINLSKYNNTELYIFIKPRKACGSTILIAELIDNITLNDNIRKARFKLSHNSNIYYTVPKDNIFNSILIYCKAADKNYFNMEVKYKALNGVIVKSDSKPIIDGGFGIIINLNKIIKGSEIIITVNKVKDRGKEIFIEVGYEIAGQGLDYKRPVHILEHVYGATDSFPNCYYMLDEFIIDKNPILIINAFTQSVNLFVNSKNDATLISKDSFDNSYMRLNMLLDEASYFCIKRYKSPETEYEEFIDTSYEFQFFYENDLPDIQMLIMPLTNGKFYTHGISYGNIMVYRHTTFSKYGGEKSTHIYSANLVKLKGNSKLYGYTCYTYPECSVDKITNQMEEIKPINLYYINKRKDAPGNLELNKNGEFLSNSRIQYLSVVICESDECEYTIEINNENDDIRLSPDKIYTTTILPGKNYFSIYVENHKNYKDMNISLTLLTGNAVMSIYFDSNLENKIQNYKYHKLFRKQIFEFKSTHINEYYWGLIECTEAAFIELKYSTDFNFNGYISLNPGEASIEYINKKSELFPYSIINPYNFYLLDKKEDRNYWFKIRTQDCSMDFLYNNQTLSNIFEVNEILKEGDENLNNDNFVFLAKVDEYNYDTNDNSADCTMFIYNGEGDSKGQPLLIISDLAISFNNINNSFIYPFIKDDNFKGIIIDIRFTDDNIGNASYKVIISVNTTIITAKDIDTDSTFFINGTDDKIKYLDNLNNLQSLLHIQVNKNLESDNIYNMNIKVYSGESSNPEIISSTENKTKLYLPNGGYKISQVSLKKNEEAQYNFNFSSGQGDIKAVLVNKNENYDINIIFDDDSSNLLNYDSSHGILRINIEETKKCDDICELIMKMTVDKATEDIVEISFEKSELKPELKEEEKNEKEEKKIDLLLAIVLIIGVALVVAGILIAIHFFFKKKKKTRIRTSGQIESRPSSHIANYNSPKKGRKHSNGFNSKNKFTSNASPK